MKRTMHILLAALAAFSLAACEQRTDTGWSIDQVPDDPVVDPVKTEAKAPLYWTVYEFCYEAEHAGTNPILMPRATMEANVEWVAENLLPYGYDMIATDGFQAMYNVPADNAQGYMTHYGAYSLKELVALCKQHGLKLGVYDNPLWKHGDDDIIIEGTNIRLGSLLYDPAIDQVEHPDAARENEIFYWIVPSHPGAKEYIDGFFKYYNFIGVNFIRMDFMCLFETGTGMGGDPGRGYGREEYELALQYINESATKYGVFTSIVMPNQKNYAELEARYMNMMRINADVFCGRWSAFSGTTDNDPDPYMEHYGESVYYRRRGQIDPNKWPTCYNLFDGMVYFSDLSGRGKLILDGDFTRLNTLSNDDERRSVISLQLVAGGPVACADQYNETDIDHLVTFYQNEELLALNKDGFVGKPLSRDLSSSDSQIWTGQMSDGDWIVAFFNREDLEQKRSFSVSTLGEESMQVRDLWEHQDLGRQRNLEAIVPAHGCKVYRLKAINN